MKKYPLYAVCKFTLNFELIRDYKSIETPSIFFLIISAFNGLSRDIDIHSLRVKDIRYNEGIEAKVEIRNLSLRDDILLLNKKDAKQQFAKVVESQVKYLCSSLDSKFIKSNTVTYDINSMKII